MQNNNFFENLRNSTSIDLNTSQRKAVAHANGPALTLAVPGSGKTTMLVCRTRYLSEMYGVSPNKILSLTFSRAAANDMKKRCSSAFGRDRFEPYFSTIHAFSYRLMKTFFERTGAPAPELIGDASKGYTQKRFLIELMKEVGSYGFSEEQIEEVANRISYSKNMMISPTDVDDGSFKAIFSKYEQKKKNLNLIDFEDMVFIALDILRKNPAFRSSVHSAYEYLQVDETQDTSKVQHAFIRELISEKKNLFMVADDDQSIYGFRGAFPSMILSFKDEFETGSIYTLSENYRSSPEIISVCSDLISSNKNRYKKSIEAVKGSGGRVSCIDFQDTEQRNDFITEKAAEISRTESFETLGILFRNNVSSVTVAQQLIESGIEFESKDGTLGFFESRIVKDISDIIEFSMVQNSFKIFERIHFKLSSFISRDLMQKARENSREDSVFNAFYRIKGIAQWSEKNIRKLEQSLRYVSNASPGEAIGIISKDLGYFEYLKKSSERLGTSMESSRIALETLTEISASFGSHTEFLIGIGDLRNAIKSSSANEHARIKLSTMHSSKGLEYDHVIIIDAQKGILPTHQAVEDMKNKDSTQIEEERRLLYVALSRAKSSLYILNSKFRVGSKIFRSEFLEDMLKSKSRTGIENIDFSANSHGSGHGGNPSCDNIVGRHFNHIKFGRGIVSDVDSDGDRIEVRFGDGQKTLSLRLCLERGIATLED